MFRPGFTALAMTADSIQAQIEAFKPMIEQIIYWENLTNTLIWSLSIVFTWILAKLGFGFGWVIILLFILG